MKKNSILVCALTAFITAAGAAGAVDFDRPAGKLELPPAPEAASPASPVVQIAARSGGSYSVLFGEYSLDAKEAGSCFDRLEIVPETFGNAKTEKNLGIYGLPGGEGLIVAQVLDINEGLQFDESWNPMVILPFQSGFMGYEPREAAFAGNKLVYKSGARSMLRPGSIKSGEIVEAELAEGVLKVRSGTFDANGAVYKDVCSYKKTK